MSDGTRETTCGHTPHLCKGLCRKCYNATYYAATAEKQREASRLWRAANPEWKREQSRAWYAANIEQVREDNARRYRANLEQRRAEARAYAKANSEAKRDAARAWREANPGRSAVANRAWREAHPEQFAALRAAYRARRQGASADLTADQWLAILAEFEGHCAYCDRTDLPLVMEHMTPLSRGGAHTASNLVPACPPCNGSKHTKTALEFAGWEIPPRRQCA